MVTVSQQQPAAAALAASARSKTRGFRVDRVEWAQVPGLEVSSPGFRAVTIHLRFQSPAASTLVSYSIHERSC
eukprot:2414128-Rhodomonas_salina.2